MPHREEHHPEGPGGRRTTGDYARDFLSNWRDYDAPLAEKVRLMIKNRARAMLLPPIKGCCGNRGQPGC